MLLLCPPKGGHIVFVRVHARRDAWCVMRDAWGVRRPQLTLSDHLKKKLFRYLHNFFYMSMVSIARLVLIFSNFWKTRWPPQPFFCWLRILTTSDQLKEKLWIYIHQTFHMDIRWHKLGWYWFSTISEKQGGRHSQFLADSEYWRRPIN